MGVAEQIAAIESALETGAESVTDEHGRTVKYGSRKEMIAALASLKSTQQATSVGREFAISPLKTSGPRN
tara:strand:- start:347 stop:556 length:210 start_codon:yes stop_codon:yes gene_type:complete